MILLTRDILISSKFTCSQYVICDITSGWIIFDSISNIYIPQMLTSKPVCAEKAAYLSIILEASQCCLPMAVRGLHRLWQNKSLILLQCFQHQIIRLHPSTESGSLSIQYACLFCFLLGYFFNCFSKGYRT